MLQLGNVLGGRKTKNFYSLSTSLASPKMFLVRPANKEKMAAFKSCSGSGRDDATRLRI